MSSGQHSEESTEPAWEERRLSFGARATDYDAVRPSYSTDALLWALGRPAPGLSVLDLGAGTGKATTILANAGASVLAVEPDDAMRAVLERTATGTSETPGRITVLPGFAEAVPLAEASVDAVVVAQAFHWFDRERAVPEIARILRPGGLLGLVWNRMDTTVEWVAEFDALTGHTPRVRDSGPPDELGAPFVPDEARDWPNVLRLSPAGLVQLAATFSWVSRNQRQAEILRDVERLASRVPTTDGVIEMPWRTGVWRYSRTDTA